MNAVRIPFNYHHFESDQAPYVYDKKGFEQIDRILSYCKKYGIYAVLDLHAAPGGQNPDWHCDNAVGESLFWETADYRERVIALWKYIAGHYKNNPWIAAYDLLNEPVLFVSDKSVIDGFFDKLIKEIRKVDKNHLLFIEGDAYTTDFSHFKTIRDKNTACTFHFYPLFFTDHISKDLKHQKESIRKVLNHVVTLKDIRNRLKRPVWCGETGVSMKKGNRKFQEKLLCDFLEILEEEGISWSMWSYKDARAMGSLHPAENSPWMKFALKACNGWEFWPDQDFCNKETERIIKRYGIEIPYIMKRKILYRVLCNYQMILAENYKNILSKIPFKEFIKYPELFRFEKCEKWEAVLDMVRCYK